MDELSALRAGHASAQVVPGVLDAGVRSAVLTQLASIPSVPLAPADSPLRSIRQWGAMSGPTPLAPQGADPQTYDARNRLLWEGLGALAAPVRAGVLGALGALAVGDVVIAPGRWPASIRCMPAGCGAPRHLDRYPMTPPFAALREHCVLDEQLVWYLMLQASPSGGALRVFSGRYAEDQGPPDSAPGTDFCVPDGALLVHPGALNWHEVEAPREGDRITIAGICAPLRNGEGWWVCA